MTDENDFKKYIEKRTSETDKSFSELLDNIAENSIEIKRNLNIGHDIAKISEFFDKRKQLKNHGYEMDFNSDFNNSRVLENIIDDLLVLINSDITEHDMWNMCRLEDSMKTYLNIWNAWSKAKSIEKTRQYNVRYDPHYAADFKVIDELESRGWIRGKWKGLETHITHPLNENIVFYFSIRKCYCEIMTPNSIDNGHPRNRLFQLNDGGDGKYYITDVNVDPAGPFDTVEETADYIEIETGKYI